MKNRYIQPSIIVIMAFLSITLLPFGKNSAEADVSKKAYNDVRLVDSVHIDSIIDYQKFICYATSTKQIDYIIVRRLIAKQGVEIKNFLIGINPNTMTVAMLETNIIHSANITWADVERKFRNTPFMKQREEIKRGKLFTKVNSSSLAEEAKLLKNKTIPFYNSASIDVQIN